jgi:predicted chitinase
MSVSPIAPQRPSPSDHSRVQHDDAAIAARPARAAHGDEIAIGGRGSPLVSALLAHVPSADRKAAQTAIPAILEAARSTGTADPNRLGYLLATAQTESDFGANMTETGHSRSWFNAEYGGADGNRPGSGDGFEYRGRGYVQTTRAGRYAELSRALHLPEVPALERDPSAVRGHAGARLEPQLVAHPERLAEPRLAAKALVIGVMRNLFTHNPAADIDKTIPTGKKPGDVDFYHARGIVNGIVHDQAVTIARHATVYARVFAAFGETNAQTARTK